LDNLDQPAQARLGGVAPTEVGADARHDLCVMAGTEKEKA